MRGFGFRKLGPEDINGDSIGGSSLIESSVEWRIAACAVRGGTPPLLKCVPNV